MKKELSIRQLALLLAGIIFTAPLLLKLPAFCRLFNLSNSGTIGDALGGLTSPFINAIGAILVYKAFKEQIKANDLIKEQQHFQHIENQIHRLEGDFMNIGEIRDKLTTAKYLTVSGKHYYKVMGGDTEYTNRNTDLLKVAYTLDTFTLTHSLIRKMGNSNRDFLSAKVRMLFLLMNATYFQSIYRDILRTRAADQDGIEKVFIDAMEETRKELEMEITYP